MKKIIEVIKKYNKIAIFSHKNPDGDTLGSQLSLGLALKKLGKEVIYYNVDPIPEYYFFLTDIDKIEPLEERMDEDCLAIYVDCADGNRVGYPMFGRETINLDHHVSNDNFADYNYVDFKAAAAGEIIYELIRNLGVDFDRNIATNIYTAISTDTGSFLYSNTTERTHMIGAEMIKYGANTAALRENFFEGISFERFSLIRYSYSNVKFAADHKIAWVTIPRKVILDINAKEEDTEGVISHLKNIKGVEVAFLLREKEDGELKASLRSKSIVDVSEIASVFSGGGHKRAAGFELNLPIEDGEKIVLEEIKKGFKNV